MKRFEMTKFVGLTNEEVENADPHQLNFFEKLERYLIIEGYTNHEICRKIEVIGFERGFDTVKVEIASTLKRHRNISFVHIFAIDEIHGMVECLEHYSMTR